jgi:uracil-DNA glycosylase
MHRKNLCDGAWSMKAARTRAFELLSPQAPWQVIILLGRKVTRAFEKLALDDVTLAAFSIRTCCPGMTLVSLPHPGGQNASLWPPSAKDRARKILQELAPEVPWGLTYQQRSKAARPKGFRGDLA